MNCAPCSHPIRVLVVDDQRALRIGVSALIDSEAPGMRVVAQASCARQALELACETRPDIVILDADLGGEDGLALIPLLLAATPLSVVVFTCVADLHVRQRALRMGADGFVSKSAPGEELLAVIRGAADCRGTLHP